MCIYLRSTAAAMELLLVLTPLSILLLLSFSISLLWLLFRTNGPKDAYPPALRPYPLIGHLPQFLKNRHRMPEWVTECLASVPTNTFVLRRPGGVRGVITANPANVEHLLRLRPDLYPKGPRFTAFLHDFLGNGIFNADGDAWRVQRKTASFEFNTRSLRSFVVRCVEHEIRDRLLPLLHQAASDDFAPSLDLQDVLERFAFDNICKVAFDQDPACLAAADSTGAGDNVSSGFAHAFNDASVISVGRFRYAVPKFWMIKRFLGVGSERRLRESIATVHDFAMQLIRSKKKEQRTSSSPLSQTEEDLLSRFIANENHSDEFLRDIVISFMLAGKDTTSSALTWFFWLLSSHPEIEAKILDEIWAVRARHTHDAYQMFDYESLREMHYLHAAITESMRLYPPVPFNSLYCLADDVLPDGTAVKKGWFMTYTSYAMGRMEAVWGADCVEYRPERWLEAETGAFRPESPFKYPVFNAGPRVCLGKEMAYIQMKAIAACVLERFKVEVVEMEAAPVRVASFTLRMKGGLPVRVRERRTQP